MGEREKEKEREKAERERSKFNVRVDRRARNKKQFHIQTERK